MCLSGPMGAKEKGWKRLEGREEERGQKKREKTENRIDAVIWVSHFRVTEFVCVLSCML